MNDPYAKMSVPDVVKNLNVKVFNLMSRTSETRHIEWHEACKCKCRLDASFCNNNQHWNDDKCRYENKELIDRGVCYKGSIWNPSNCECECDKSCDFSEYLDYKNCKCRKKMVVKLMDECTENVKEVKLAKITSTKLNSAEEGKKKHKCSFCTPYIVLFLILFTINVGIDSYFLYFHWYLKNMSLVLILVPILSGITFSGAALKYNIINL